MRFLKKKIALARSFHADKAEGPKKTTTISEENDIQQQSIHPQSSPKIGSSSESYRATKNIVKNYGRAISAFALSKLAAPYLDKVLENEGLTIQQFTRYITQIRGKIDGLTHFRSTILIAQDDNSDIAANKRAFIAISEVFIKYFSVNWIYNSRVFHKEAHLKFRFKMLRRIQRPELFTYLRGKNRHWRDLYFHYHVTLLI